MGLINRTAPGAMLDGKGMYVAIDVAGETLRIARFQHFGCQPNDGTGIIDQCDFEDTGIDSDADRIAARP